MKRRKSIYNRALNIICVVALVVGSIGVPGVSYAQGDDVEGVFSEALSEDGTTADITLKLSTRDPSVTVQKIINPDGTETAGSLSGGYTAAANQTYDFVVEYTVQAAAAAEEGEEASEVSEETLSKTFSYKVDSIAEQPIEENIPEGEAPEEETPIEEVPSEEAPIEETQGTEAAAEDEGPTSPDYFQFDIKGGEATIISYSVDNLAPKNVVIPPATRDGEPITKIGPNAFQGRQLTGIVFNDAITSIGDAAFKNNNGITGIVAIPDSVKTIGKEAFSGCTGISELNLGTGVTTIGDQAFYNCQSVPALTIPDSVTSLGEQAFFGFRSMESLTISNSLSVIPYFTFGYAQKLSSVTLPDSVERVEQYAFASSGLTNIVWSSNLKSIGAWAFQAAKFTTIEVPNSVKEIGRNAFESCKELTEAELPEYLTSESLPVAIFSNCVNLKKVTLPKNITRIEVAAFDHTGLEEFIFPDTVQTVDKAVFDTCRSLRSVTFGSGLRELGEEAFKYCDKLTTVNMGSEIEKIGSHAFLECTSLENLTIPGSVTSIGANIFRKEVRTNQLKLKTLNIEGAGSLEISDQAFFGCDSIGEIFITRRDEGSVENAPWSADKAVIHWQNGKTLPITMMVDNGKYEYNTQTKTITKYFGTEQEVVVPSEFEILGSMYPVEAIGQQAFYQNTTIQKVTVPSSVKTIGRNAFAENTALREVILEDGVESIDLYAFAYCGNLVSVSLPETLERLNELVFTKSIIKEIVIPGSVSYIGDAFSQCSTLEKVTIEGSGKLEIVGGPFYASELSLKNIYILGRTKGSIEYEPWGAMYATIHWKDGEIEDPTYIDTGEFIYDRKTKSIIKYKGTGTSVEIPSRFIIDGVSYPVEKLGAGAFDQNTTITDVVMANSVTEIDQGCFNGCTSLSNVVLSDHLKIIGPSAFSGCTNLKNIEIPESVYFINMLAFANTGLTSIVIPSGVTHFAPSNPFSGCSNLQSIYIEQSHGTQSWHLNQPWGAPTGTKVYYLGEYVTFNHTSSITEGGYDIDIRAYLLNPAKWIQTVELPDGTSLGVGNRIWPRDGGSYTYHVKEEGIYTFKSTDSSGVPQEYPVEIREAKVTYHSNGGTTEEITKEERGLVGGSHRLSFIHALEMGDSDQLFVEWNTKADGTGSSYGAGDTLKLSGDIDLYAVWQEIPEGTALFRIRRGDEGLGYISKTVYTGTPGTKLGINAAEAVAYTTVKGAKFIGWYNKGVLVDDLKEEVLGTGKGNAYEARFMLDRDNNNIDDREQDYTVKFVVREGDEGKAVLSTNEATIPYGEKLGDNAANFVIDTAIGDFTVDGWYKNRDDKAKVENLADEVITDNVTYELRIKGEITKYRVTFKVDETEGYLGNDPNNTDTYYQTYVVDKNKSLTVPYVTPRNPADAHVGWYEEDDSKQEVIRATGGMQLEIDHNATYVALIKTVTANAGSHIFRSGEITALGIEIGIENSLDKFKEFYFNSGYASLSIGEYGLPDAVLNDWEDKVKFTLVSGNLEDLKAGMTGIYGFTYDDLNPNTPDAKFEIAIVGDSLNIAINKDLRSKSWEIKESLMIGLSKVKDLTANEIAKMWMDASLPMNGYLVKEDGTIELQEVSKNPFTKFDIQADDLKKIQEMTEEGDVKINFDASDDGADGSENTFQFTCTLKVVDDNPLALVEIPKSIELEKKAGDDAVEAEASAKVSIHADKESVINKDVSVYTVGSFSLIGEGIRPERMGVKVYTDDTTQYDDSQPLAVLNPTGDKEKSFLLKAVGKPEGYQRDSYKGTLDFTIRYGD